MDTEEKMTKLIAIYLLAIGRNGKPNGHVYSELMADCQALVIHNAIIETLINNGLASQSNYFVTLTAKGLALHDKVESIALGIIAKQSIATQTPNG